MNELFYKVIHNKYLFNKIINEFDNSSSSSNNEYEYIEQIKYNNSSRKKFKDINSFYWMIENKQLPLLKCKLEAGELINHELILNEIEELYGINISSDWLEIQNENDPEEVEEKKQLFKLILRTNSWFSNTRAHRDISLSMYKSIHQLHPSLIQVALNYDTSSYNSIQVFPSTLDMAFIHSSPEQIKELLDAFIGYGNSSNQNTRDLVTQFKNQIINNSFKMQCIFQRDKVLQIILSDPKYYNIPSISSSSTTTSSSVDKSPSTYSTNTTSALDLVELLFDIISTDVQNRLLDLKLYEISTQLEPLKDQFEDIINNNSSNNRIIKLIQLIRDSSSSDNYMNNIQINKHPGLIVRNLKSLLFNNQYDWKGLFSQELVGLDYSGVENIGEEYIEYYGTLELKEEYKWFRIDALDNTVKKELKKLSSIKFIKFMNSLANTRFTNAWEKVSGHKDIEIVYPVFKFKSLEAVNHMAEYYEQLNEMSHIVSRYTSYELYKYSKSKQLKGSVLLNEDYTVNKLYSSLLQDSIISNNLKEIKEIQEGYGIQNFKSLHLSFAKKYYGHGTFTKETIQILNHFVSTDMPMEYVYYCLKYNLPPPSSSPSIAPNDINFNSGFKSLQIWMGVFIKAIKSGSAKIIEFFINNNFNPIIKHSNIFKNLWIDYSRKNDQPIALFEYQFTFETRFCTREEGIKKPSKIIQIIKLLIQDFNKVYTLRETGMGICDGKSSGIPIRDFLQSIIDSLFQTLIQIKGLPIERAHEVYSIISSSGHFGILNSASISIYLLSIRSLKFIKYIQGLPFFIINLPNNQMDTFTYQLPLYDNETNVGPEVYIYDLRKYLHWMIFNFHFIHLSSFEEILNRLIDQLSYNTIAKFKVMDMEDIQSTLAAYQDITLDQLIHQVLNYNLEFCLDINRPDLFMEQLVIVQDRYSDHFNKDFAYSTKLITQCLYYGGSVLEALLNTVKPDQPSQLYKLKHAWPVDQYELNLKNYNQIQHLNIFKPQHLEYSCFKYHQSVFTDSNYLNHLNQLSNLKGTATDRLYSQLTKLPFEFYKSLLQLYGETCKFIQPSKAMIDYSINYERLNFLKYIYNQNLLNDQLSIYLKSRLNSNSDYCYLNWLN